MPDGADHTSARDWQDPSTYRAGTAELLARLRAFDGSAPAAEQHRVLAELAAYARADEGMYAPTTTLPADIVASFHEHLRQIAALLDPEVIRSHPGLTRSLRLGLLGLRTGEALHTAPRRRTDVGRGLDRVSYLVTGTPTETSEALHRKTRAIELIGASITSERILWVPTGSAVAVTGSREVDLPPEPATAQSTLAKARGRSPLALARTVLHDRALLRRSRRPDVAKRYAGAWLLMDRDTFAQDNAEHLYRHLLAHEPDVNAHFVLRRESNDWQRLEDDGFRLIPYGSDEYYLALLHCAHLISSQVDGYVVRPLLGHLLGPQRWRYTFLQHGVIIHDLSRWLNIKPIDLMVTSAPGEHASVVGDGTHYELTDLEVKQVGLARHDRLVRLGPQTTRRRMLVTPTWRSELLEPQTDGNRRGLLPDFWSSRYASEWAGLLSSPELKAICERAGWQITFMPHPNMQDYLDSSPLPPQDEQ